MIKLYILVFLLTLTFINCDKDLLDVEEEDLDSELSIFYRLNEVIHNYDDENNNENDLKIQSKNDNGKILLFKSFTKNEKLTNII